MLCGFAAETALQNLVSQHRRLKPLRFNTLQVLEVARSHPIGLKRLEAAEPHLKAQYGIPLKNGKIHLIWESVPASVLLDYVLAVDVAFGFLGWNYALDVTTNPQAVDEKYRKLKKLRPLFERLEIERVGVCLLQSNVIDCARFFSHLPRHELFSFSL